MAYPAPAAPAAGKNQDQAEYDENHEEDVDKKNRIGEQ